MNKEQYKELELELVLFENDDVIVTSGPVNPQCDWLSEIICGKVT